MNGWLFLNNIAVLNNIVEPQLQPLMLGKNLNSEGIEASGSRSEST